MPVAFAATTVSSDPCAGASTAGAPLLSSNGGLSMADTIAISLYGECMVGAVNNLLINEQFYGQALDHARTTTVSTMGTLYNLIKPIMFWEMTVQELGTNCTGIGTADYQTVINEKTAEALAYYKVVKPNITATTSSDYAAARTEASQSVETKREVLALNPGPALRTTLNTEVTQRAQPGVLDALLQAPWNLCHDSSDYSELMNLMVNLDSPDAVKDAAQYCGTLLQAQTRNTAGTVIDTLNPNLGGVRASQKRTSGNINAAKNATLVLDGPIQELQCPPGYPGSESLTLKLDGATIKTGLTAPYLSNPLEIDIAAALQAAHPTTTAQLTQAVVTLERTGTICSDFWGVNPAPFLSLTLTFSERKIVFDRQFYQGATQAGYGREIDSIKADGTGFTQITNNPPVSQPDGEGGTFIGPLYADSSPALSPDGRRIAFVRNNFLSVMTADGSSIAPLTAPALYLLGDASPAWSPDGTKIAFRRHENDCCGGGAATESMCLTPAGAIPP